MGGDDTLSRVLHDVGLAAWHGGYLMGTVGLPAAAGGLEGLERFRAEKRAWQAYNKVALPAIAAHLVGGAGLTWGNKARLAAQSGAAGLGAVKTALTAAAIGATVYARRLGRKVEQEAERGDRSQAESLRSRLAMAQGAVLAATAGIAIVAARMGEQQRPRSVLRGVLDRARTGR